jgi:hypothetical protein
LRTGKDATVVTSLAIVPRAQVVAEKLAAEGIEVEVIDILAPRPMNLEPVIESVGRCPSGVEAFDHLDSPPKRRARAISASDNPAVNGERGNRITLPGTAG